MSGEPWLKDILVFLVGAGLIVPLFHRARIGAVLGFLLFGVAGRPLRPRAMGRDPSVAALPHHRASRAGRALRRARHLVPAVPDRRRAVGRAAVVVAPLRDRRRRPGFRALRGGDCGGARVHRPGRRRRHRARARPRNVVDRGGDAAARGAGPQRDHARAAGILGAAVPGPDGGAGAVRRADARHAASRASRSVSRSRSPRRRWRSRSSRWSGASCCGRSSISPRRPAAAS